MAWSLLLTSVLGSLPTSPILDGAVVDECGWPSAVTIRVFPSQCSGVLVHPQIALLDRTCPEFSPDEPTILVQFGEGEFGPTDPSISVPREDCTFNTSLGFCVLPEPVEIPYAPILTGCESDLLQEGMPVTMVGFGADAPDGFSQLKRSGNGTIASVNGTTFSVEGDHGPCPGDSGGPAFMRMGDGSWRTAGLAATTQCASPSSYTNLSAHVEWIETESGIDITPCHAPDGTPEASAACGGFFSGGDGGDATWADLCAAAPVLVDAVGCPADLGAPTVAITSPGVDTDFAEDVTTLSIEVEADDAGLGVRDVRLQIDGELLPTEDTQRPFSFEVELPAGVWSVEAVASDWADNVAYSEARMITIGQAPGAANDSGGPDDDSGDGASPESTGTSGGTDGSGQDELDGDDGCGCRGGSGGPGAPIWLSLALLGGWRRRERADD